MANESVVVLTDANFDQEVLNCSDPVLVDFWAEWCGPCRMLAPTIDELASEYKGKVKVGKVDTDSNRNIAMKFNISAIPTIILFSRGQTAKRFVGLTPKRDFKAAIDSIVGQKV
ncbi:MAG TPA: thioredoxin [Phycisphaerae bacterium]|nr:thioredoxin [Phycisphaerae bacterium]